MGRALNSSASEVVCPRGHGQCQSTRNRRRVRGLGGRAQCCGVCARRTSAGCGRFPGTKRTRVSPAHRNAQAMPAPEGDGRERMLGQVRTAHARGEGKETSEASRWEVMWISTISPWHHTHSVCTGQRIAPAQAASAVR
eukprot:3847392-Rhodomonas_salina.2